jgi:hypothetical protein
VYLGSWPYGRVADKSRDDKLVSDFTAGYDVQIKSVGTLQELNIL